MKEIKSNTSAANKKLIPWFKTMGKQIGLSQSLIAAVLKEQRIRIHVLTVHLLTGFPLPSRRILERAMACGMPTVNWHLFLNDANTFHAGAGRVHIVLPLSNCIIRGWISAGSVVYIRSLQCV